MRSSNPKVITRAEISDVDKAEEEETATRDSILVTLGEVTAETHTIIMVETVVLTTTTTEQRAEIRETTQWAGLLDTTRLQRSPAHF